MIRRLINIQKPLRIGYSSRRIFLKGPPLDSPGDRGNYKWIPFKAKLEPSNPLVETPFHRTAIPSVTPKPIVVRPRPPNQGGTLPPLRYSFPLSPSSPVLSSEAVVSLYSTRPIPSRAYKSTEDY